MVGAIRWLEAEVRKPTMNAQQLGTVIQRITFQMPTISTASIRNFLYAYFPLTHKLQAACIRRNNAI